MESFEKLEYSELPESAQRSLPQDAPFGTKVVASRALLPLISSDLVALLYHLCFDEDERISSTARDNLIELPDNILAPVLAVTTTSPKVLAFCGLSLMDRENILEAVVLNASSPDEVLAGICLGTRSERIIEMIAANQQRVLRHPQLIASLAKNEATPKSTLDRIERFYLLQTGRNYFEDIEGAEPVTADELGDKEYEPGAEEPFFERTEETYEEGEKLLQEDLPPDLKIEDLLREKFDVDEVFAKEFLVDPETELSSEKRESLENRIRKMNVVTKMRLGLKGNIEARNILIKNPNKIIQECVIRNPQISLDEVVRIARNKTMREELIRMVAKSREWTKNYQVRINLIYNPKTPLTMAMKWLPSLTKKDLERLAKSKQIPGMLAVTARKALQAKDRYT